MQHNWNELSESTKNFMRNQNFKQELREAYQEGYQDSMNEDIAGLFRLGRRFLSPKPLGGGAGGLFGNFQGNFGAFLNTLIGANRAFAEQLAQHSDILRRLLNFAQADPQSARIFTGMLEKILRNMEALTQVPPPASAIEFFQLYARQLVNNGMEFFNDGGQVGIREIPGYDGDLMTGFMAEFYEALADLFDAMDIPWNDDLGRIISQNHPGYDPPPLP